MIIDIDYDSNRDKIWINNFGVLNLDYDSFTIEGRLDLTTGKENKDNRDFSSTNYNNYNSNLPNLIENKLQNKDSQGVQNNSKLKTDSNRNSVSNSNNIKNNSELDKDNLKSNTQRSNKSNVIEVNEMNNSKNEKAQDLNQPIEEDNNKLEFSPEPEKNISKIKITIEKEEEKFEMDEVKYDNSQDEVIVENHNKININEEVNEKLNSIEKEELTPNENSNNNLKQENITDHLKLEINQQGNEINEENNPTITIENQHSDRESENPDKLQQELQGSPKKRVSINEKLVSHEYNNNNDEMESPREYVTYSKAKESNKTLSRGSLRSSKQEMENKINIEAELINQSKKKEDEVIEN